MKFYLQWDGRTKSRADRQYGRNGFQKINHAIAALKTQTNPRRICAHDSKNNKNFTIMLFEGIKGIGIFTSNKKASLMCVGVGMYIPKTCVRKTNKKRKMKCKK